jgi:hypothetical protein
MDRVSLALSPPWQQAQPLLVDVVEEVRPGEAPPPAQVEKTTWIAFELVDDEGHAVTRWGCRLKLGAGSGRSGTTGDGEIRITPIAPGTCVHSLQVEGAAVAPAAAAAHPDEVTIEDNSTAAATQGILEGVVTDADGHPLANRSFEARFPDGKVMHGQTDTSIWRAARARSARSCSVPKRRGPTSVQ